MIGWWTVLDVIKQVKSSARQAGDGDCPDWLALLLGWFSWGFLIALLFGV